MSTVLKEEEKPTSEEAEILSEHQSRIVLHDGLLGHLSDFIANSGCIDCNRKLEWELLYDENNKNLATSYVAKHCRRQYSIQLESAGVRVSTLSDEEARKQVKEQKDRREHRHLPQLEVKRRNDLEESEIKRQAELEKAKKDAERVAQLAEDERTRAEAARVAKLAEQEAQNKWKGVYNR